MYLELLEKLLGINNVVLSLFILFQVVNQISREYKAWHATAQEQSSGFTVNYTTLGQ